ncbi:GGDEF domain-containing protein [Methylobacterium sp. P31]
MFTAAQASRAALSIALFDLDHFKGINDRHGHEAGDAALVHLARHIQLATSAGNRFSRLGGDESLLVAKTDTDELSRCLMEALEELPPLDLRDGSSLRLSVSIGVAQAIAPDDAWPDLMRRADRALYEAKARGRCRVSCAA